MEVQENRHPSEVVKEPVYDVVIVYGGNIRRKGNKFFSTNFEEGPEKSIGAHSRTRAAAELYKRGEVKYFITSTGKTHPDEDAPSEAAVMKAELVRFGVPPEAIIVEDRSLTTMGNAEEAAKIIREQDFKNIGVLTSSWHLRRTKAMLDTQGLETEGRTIKLLSPERILMDKSPHYKKLIRYVYARESMKQRIKNEKQGYDALKSGTYQSRPIEYKPEEKKTTT